MKKYRKITYNGDPEKYVYVPADPRGSFSGPADPGGSFSVSPVSLKEGEELLKAVAYEEFHMREKRARLDTDYNLALLANKKPPKVQTLFEAFKSDDQYQRMMNYFVLKKIVSPDSYSWIDNSQGNIAAALDLLNELYIKGYFRKRLTAGEKKAVLSNTFGIVASLDYIKEKNKNIKAAPKEINLPPASEY